MSRILDYESEDDEAILDRVLTNLSELIEIEFFQAEASRRLSDTVFSAREDTVVDRSGHEKIELKAHSPDPIKPRRQKAEFARSQVEKTKLEQPSGFKRFLYVLLLVVIMFALFALWAQMLLEP